MAKRKKKKSYNKKKRRYNRKKKGTFLGFLLKWIVVLSIWAFIVATGLILWFQAGLPKIAANAAFDYKSSIIVLAKNGEVLARYGESKGESISLNEVPQHLVHAVVAIEDRRFYSHFGLDIIGLGRAMAVNLAEGRIVQGGSTITQQLAKNLFLSPERTFKRKIQEALLAIKLEQELTKDEILAAYLNRVYMGSGAYGVEAASRLYFEKPASDITVGEAAILAGLLRAPTRYSPRRNPELSQQRAKTVLKAMKREGYITTENQKIPQIISNKTAQSNKTGTQNRYFTDWVIDELEDLIGSSNENLVVYTALDKDVQLSANQALQDTLAAQGTAKNIGQGAVIVMRPDGAVISLIGGRNYSQSQFNRAVQAKRQPGSAFKPVVYLAALEKGWNPGDTILDGPITEGEYRPENFQKKYFGNVTLTQALAKSMNTAALRLAQDTGIAAIRQKAKALGITSNLANDFSIALGSGALSPLEMTSAYAAIANGGFRITPYAITRVENDNGTLYYSRPQKSLIKERAASKQSVRKLRVMMQEVMKNGTGKNAALSFKTGGKSGTSQDYRDAWFAGFSDDVIVTVWLGNDNNAPMKNVTGGQEPAQIWKQVMQHAPTGKGFSDGLWDFEEGGGFDSLLDRLFSSSY